MTPTLLATLLSATTAYAYLKAPTAKPEIRRLTSGYYTELVGAVEEYEAKTPGALTKVRAALNKLQGREEAAKLPFNADMTDDKLSAAIKRVRVARATLCSAPVVVFYIFPQSGPTRYEEYYSHTDAPSLSDVRDRNPDCEVQKVNYSFTGS